MYDMIKSIEVHVQSVYYIISYSKTLSDESSDKVQQKLTLSSLMLLKPLQAHGRTVVGVRLIAGILFESRVPMS